MMTHGRVNLWISALIIGVLGEPSRGFMASSALSLKAFAKPELGISTAAVPLSEVMSRLPNSAAWTSFLAEQPSGVVAHIDPRSATPAGVMLRAPLIPGTGKGNTVTVADLQVSLARPVTEVDSEVVAAAVRSYVLNNLDVLAVAPNQLGSVQAAQVTDSLWEISIPQVAGGVPVRRARLVASLSHGNLVLLGTAMWGNVQTDPRPSITADAAVGIGFTYAGERLPEDTLWKQPVLELIPYAPVGREVAYQPGGPIGQGYGHRLVWTFGFERTSEVGLWEVLVDAHAGEVIAFRDVIQEVEARIKGGVYPATNTEICPSSDQRCGIMQSAFPMPWANTGLAAPNDFTNGAGVFDYTSGAVTTTLHGKYYKVTTPACGGNLSETALSGGELDLGGVNGDHFCQSSGNSLGNVPAARTAYYAANKIAEIARGWLPNNGWLRTIAPNQFLIKANQCPAFGECTIESTSAGGCQSVYRCCPTFTEPDAPFIKLGRGKIDSQDPLRPWVCRPMGEIPSVVDHEWGHALDDNDRPGTPGNGDLSNPAEAYADIAAMYREQASCIFYGLRGLAASNDQQCDRTSDRTGFNQKLNDVVGQTAHCFTDCNGIREADYAKHQIMTVPPTPLGPDTPQNFVFDQCNGGVEFNDVVCKREPHCAAAPVDQAAWDLATRDLRGLPFGYDPGTAFIVANKLFYQGSGAIGSWYTCDDVARTSNGCAADNAYRKWLVADDDNGDPGDGTPHATAIYAAFHRHGIACALNVPAAADHVTQVGRLVPPTTYTDTWTSNDVRETLEEGLEGGASRLRHVWKFVDITSDLTRALIVEGIRPSNAEGDNYKFFWSNTDIAPNAPGWTEIVGADIKKPFELQGGGQFPFTGAYAPTVYIKVEDTVASGPILDRVHIDLLAIGKNPQNSGCAGGPTQPPTLTAVPGSYEVSLSWTPVLQAAGYWVFRTEGHAGCSLGMALIAKPTATSYVDPEVAAGHQYCYAVMAAGGNGSEASRCFGVSSTCQCVTPTT